MKFDIQTLKIINNISKEYVALLNNRIHSVPIEKVKECAKVCWQDISAKYAGILNPIWQKCRSSEDWQELWNQAGNLRSSSKIGGPKISKKRIGDKENI